VQPGVSFEMQPKKCSNDQSVHKRICHIIFESRDRTERCPDVGASMEEDGIERLAVFKDEIFTDDDDLETERCASFPFLTDDFGAFVEKMRDWQYSKIMGYWSKYCRKM
jgi:hypothetical protein